MTSALLKRLELNLASERVAIRAVGGGIVSYAELKTESEAVVAGLIAINIKKGDRILLLAKPSARVVSFVLAALRIGAVIVVADPGMGKEVLKARIEQSKPVAVLLDPALSLLRYHPVALALARRNDGSIPDVFGVSFPRIILDTTRRSSRHMTLGKLRQGPGPLHGIDVADDDEAVIVYTSGTTALPKGVVHTHRSLEMSMSAMESIIDKDNRFYAKLAYFLLVGIGIGAEVILDSEKKAPRAVFGALGTYEVTSMFGPPAEFLKLYEYAQENDLKFPRSMRHLLFGSAPIHVPFLKKIETIVLPEVSLSCLYGMTEALPIAWVDGRRKIEWNGEGDLLGKAVSGIRIRTQDDELFVSGNAVAPRYIEGAQADEVATGDLVRLEKDNSLVLIGRKKDMILRRSFNIYPELYESTIEQIDGIAACAMVGVYDEAIHDEVVWLCIQWESSARQQSERDLMATLESGAYSIDSDALPDKIVYTTLPRSGRQHKIDKNALRRQCTAV